MTDELVITIMRDGDEPGSAADKAVHRALDSLLLQAAGAVRVTETPIGADANSILCEQGEAALRDLILNAPPAKLSSEGEIERCAQLRNVDYDRVRRGVARRLGIRVGVLDQEVAHARAAKAPTAQQPEGEEPFEEDVDLATVLDEFQDEFNRYIVAEQHQSVVAALWTAMSHLVQKPSLINVAPRLSIQGPDFGCGKTATLELISSVCPTAIMASSISTAAIYRVIEERHPTLFIDEADRLLLNRNDEIIGVLDSGHRRSSAFVIRVEYDPITGGWHTREFSTWAAMAFAGINRLPDTLQDRSIVLTLKKALPGEVKFHLRDGISPELILLRRKYAAWAARLLELPDVILPAGLSNRHGDNWLPLFRIAEAAGGDWPAKARAAALRFTPPEGRVVPLLQSIKSAFGPREFLQTDELLNYLNSNQDYDWSTANKGRPVTAYWLRGALVNLIEPKGSKRLKENSKGHRGYYRSQFLDAFARYLPVQPNTPDAATDPSDATDAAADMSTNYQVAEDATITNNLTPDDLDNFDAVTGSYGPMAASVTSGSGLTDAIQIADKDNIALTQAPDGSDGSDGSDAANRSTHMPNVPTTDPDEVLL